VNIAVEYIETNMEKTRTAVHQGESPMTFARNLWRTHQQVAAKFLPTSGKLAA
jgi:hypothetical protein